MEGERQEHRDVWFEENVLPYENELRSWLSIRFPQLTDLDDVVQEVFFKIVKASRSGPIVNPRAYLFLVARNLVFTRFRKLKFEQPPGRDEYSFDGVSDSMQTPLESIERQEEIQILFRAIGTLPKRCRQVIALRKIYGYSLRETGKLLGISVKTVDAQSCIALAKISEYFRTHGFGGDYKWKK